MSTNVEALKLLTRRELAELLGLAPKTLANWLVAGDGPPVVRLGRAVRYEPAAVRAWLETRGAQR